MTHPNRAGQPPRALVTGGAGFIGSHLAEVLLARGDHVSVVDDLSTGRRRNLPQAHPRLTFLHADLRGSLPSLAREGPFDEIYHLAAAVGVRLVVEQPIRAIETNVEQTAALLHFAHDQLRAGHAPRVLVASSSEVYGKSAKPRFAEEDDVLYGPTTVTRWSYACSKAIDEYLALAHARQHRLPVVVARFFNTVGPRQVGDYGMVLPTFVAAALAGENLPVHGEGRQSRCFCDVRDVARALPRLLANPACHARVFNVGSDEPVQIAQLADLVVRTLGSTSRIALVPYDRAYGPGFEDLHQRRPDLARIRQAIDFRPSIPLRQTIADLADSIRAEQARPTQPAP